MNPKLGRLLDLGLAWASVGSNQSHGLKILSTPNGLGPKPCSLTSEGDGSN